MTQAPEFYDRGLSLALARVSEAAALASADLIGRGDEKAADQTPASGLSRASVSSVEPKKRIIK